ncbi:MAG TPA: class I SAM-dependent methyltransferase [Gemmataceae bacterium]|nr:class I SAM-dependent methyltransferase [Gemmataceae bacterium]
MATRVSRRNDCRLCNSWDLELVLPLAPTPIGDHYVPRDRLGEVQETYPLDLYLCHGCGHVQMLDTVDPEALFGDYLYVTSSSPGLVEHFRKYADDLLDRLRPLPGSLVVEFGSNDGSLLRFFQAQGMRVLGVDPARAIAERATQNGIETVPAFFTSGLARQIRRERGPAALITANNVFAHADNLTDIADGIHDLLASDGVFCFEVSYLVDLMDNMVFDSIYHEHLCYHSVKPLDTFFRRHGLELIDAAHVGTKGGSLRCTVQLAGGPRPLTASVGRLIALEAQRRLDQADTFHVFAARIDRAKQAVARAVHDLRRQGKMIAGFGASVTTTTLIYHFDLGDKLSYIVDDNSARHNLYSPGHHIPVVGPQAMYEQKPASVVILAWRYAEPIMKKHQAYREQGGQFIVPLPALKVA